MRIIGIIRMMMMIRMRLMMLVFFLAHAATVQGGSSTVLLATFQIGVQYHAPQTALQSAIAWSASAPPPSGNNNMPSLLNAVAASVVAALPPGSSSVVSDAGFSNATAVALAGSPQTCASSSLWTYVDTATGACRACTLCVGQYQVRGCVTADTVCAAVCPAGTFAHTGGTIGAGALGGCTACAPGTYTDAAGRTACAQCPAGAYTPAHGASGCMDCAAGTSSSALNGVGCLFTVSASLTHERSTTHGYKRGEEGPLLVACLCLIVH